MGIFNKEEKRDIANWNFIAQIPPIPKSKEVQIIAELLAHVEIWGRAGDSELLQQAWKTIAARSAKYAEQVPDNSVSKPRENIQVEADNGTVRTSTGK
jgi:hypothetical protein